MAGQLQALIERLSRAFTARSEQMSGAAHGTDFFSEEENLAAVFKIFDRKAYVDKLRSLDQDSHEMGDWVAAKSPVEFMCGLERDTRARFKSRLGNYRAASLSKKMPPLFFERFRRSIEKLEKKD